MLAVVVLWTGAAVSPAVAADDGDWQVWNRSTMSGRIGDRWKVSVFEEFRLGDDAEQLHEELIDMGIACQLSGWLGVGVNYRHVYQRSGTQWKMEKRPHFNLTLSWTRAGFQLQDRSRLELRKREGKDDVWRYRNKLTVKLPKGLAPWVGRPYAAVEGFVDLDRGDDKFSRYRLYGGIARPVLGPIQLDLHYMRQSSRAGDDWMDYNVVGAGLKADF